MARESDTLRANSSYAKITVNTDLCIDILDMLILACVKCFLKLTK